MNHVIMTKYSHQIAIFQRNFSLILFSMWTMHESIKWLHQLKYFIVLNPVDSSITHTDYVEVFGCYFFFFLFLCSIACDSVTATTKVCYECLVYVSVSRFVCACNNVLMTRREFEYIFMLCVFHFSSLFF